MLNPQIFTFLDELSQNNTREWFAANKERYDRLKKEFDGFATQLIALTGRIDKEISYLEPKNCTYRIYRDTRFSHDKTPYKNNMGVFMVKGGKSSGNAGYYLHVENNGCFLAGGVYMPMPDVLKKIRKEIYDNIDEFVEIVESKTFKSHFKELDAEQKLKNPPKDFPKDFEYIDFLKYKSFTVSKPISEKLLLSSDFFTEAETVFSALAPFNQFMNNAIKN